MTSASLGGVASWVLACLLAYRRCSHAHMSSLCYEASLSEAVTLVIGSSYAL